MTNNTQTVESTNYQLLSTFDALNRPLTQTLPGGEALTYSYNSMGALSSLSGTNTYVSLIHYAPSGQVRDQLLGNNLFEQFCYDAHKLRPTGFRVYSGEPQNCGTNPATPKLSLSYVYQPNGNVSQMIDTTRSETLTYTYDDLDRLLSVSGPYSRSYTYNTIGNILTGNGSTYTYGDAAHKHAVTSLSGGAGTYLYDANGNMTSRTEGGLTYTQTFDAENRLISVVVNGQTTSFAYDGDGNLVKKTKPDGSKTIFVGGLYEEDKNSGGTITRKVTYYPAGGAMRINITGGSNTVYYILKDKLGSASVVTDTSGNIVGEARYYAYGETRLTTGAMNTDKLFTGQREMTGLGIYHYGSRFYSPKLGRFLSADTIVPNPANPQDLNRYSYVLNNPIDPGNLTNAYYGGSGGLSTHNINSVAAEWECQGGICVLSGGSVTLSYGADYSVRAYENLLRVTVRERYWLPSRALPLLESSTFGDSLLISQLSSGQQAYTNLGDFVPGNLAYQELTPRETIVSYYGSQNFPTQLTIRVTFGSPGTGGNTIYYQLPDLLP